MAQNAVWVLVGLLSLSIPLIALARRAEIPYPIVLVAGGLALGFVPGLPTIKLDPTLVLVIFLPPLLYWQAITAPTEAMRENASQIWVLAIGLVLATTAAVAVAAHALAGMPWVIAFVLGAIVAPTDELASAPVLARLRMPRHLIAVVEGESLLNDASALILYVAAVGAAVSGSYSSGRIAAEFVLAALGGIAIGLIVSRFAVFGWRRVGDSQLQSVISVTLPYLSYSLASLAGCSGVLAVVYAGFHANRETPTVLLPEARVRLTGFWETAVFLINVVLFVLLGMQLHAVASAVFAEYSVGAVLWYAFVVNAAVIGVRFAWLVGQEFLPSFGRAAHPAADWKHAVIAGWSGLRGAVSLAAALAIPVSIAGGAHFPYRNLIIFLTFSVILVTLVGGGLTLGGVVRRLGGAEPEDRGDGEELQRGVEAMSRAALTVLRTIERKGRLSADQVASLRRRYEHRREHAGGHPDDESPVFEAERELIEAERRALVELRERGEIDNTNLRRLLRLLDFSLQGVASNRRDDA